MQKFALIGTSCSGKTTLTYKILSQLKEMGISCDGVLQQDRRFAFDRAALEEHKEAQYYFICNQVMREVELTLRGHAEVLVSDRSVLDLYAYYETMYGRNDQLLGFVTDWLSSYTRLYYLDPLTYVDDKQRPSDPFRLAVDKTLQTLIKNIDFVDRIEVSIPRDAIAQDVFKTIGRLLTTDDLTIIPEVLELPEVLIGGSYAFNRATKYSDVDVYVLFDFIPRNGAAPSCGVLDFLSTKTAQLTKVLGIKVDITVVNGTVYNYLQLQGFKTYARPYDVRRSDAQI